MNAVLNDRVTSCRSCRAEIFWAQSPAGKAIPVDAKPVPEGQYVVAADGEKPQLVKFVDGEHDNRARFDSHFKTCDRPSSWSKRNGGK